MSERQTFYRRVIRIRGCDSPNVRLALAQIAAGREPTHEQVVPGVLSYAEFLKRSDPNLFDEHERSVVLNAEFYEGKSVRLFPMEWLDLAHSRADLLGANIGPAEAIGIDTAEGGDNTCASIVNRLGLIDLESLKTPDTSVIPGWVEVLIKRWKVDPRKVCFDAGGGGRQHADALRRKGLPVQTVAFGGMPSAELMRRAPNLREKQDFRDDRYTYSSMRAEMYGDLSELLNPCGPGFALPRRFKGLREQLSPIPKVYHEGKLYLPPKSRKAVNSKEPTLIELIGHSPDEADSLVVAIHALLGKTHPQEVRVL